MDAASVSLGVNATLRLAPVWLCLLVHCSGGHWPSSWEVTRRLADYSFSVEHFREDPWVLLTHMFVHATDEHLMGNMVSMASVLMEFGGASLADNVSDADLPRILWRTIGSLVVMVVGGAVGGIGGQLVFNDARRIWRRERWCRSIEAATHEGGLDDSAHGGWRDTGVAVVAVGALRWLRAGLDAVGWNGLAQKVDQALAAPPEPSALSAVTQLLRQSLDSATGLVRKSIMRTSDMIEKRMNERMFMCGASAGICSISGFNAAYYGRWFTGVTMLGPEVFAIAQTFISHKRSRSLFVASSIVGHAAHIGGFAAGYAIGWAVRHAQATRRRRLARGTRSGTRLGP